MSAFTLKTVAAGVIAIAFVTVSALSVMAAPANKTIVHTKAAVHAQAVKKAAATKKGIGSKAAIAAKRSIGARKLAADTIRPTVLEEIVIEKAPAKTAMAAPAFRRHFFRGQA